MKTIAILVIVIQLSSVKYALCTTGVRKSCTFANIITFVQDATKECSLCMKASEAKLLLAGLTTVIVFLAAPAAVSYMMWMLGVVAVGPVAGGVVAWLMQMGAPMWLIALLQAVGMGGLGYVGSALFAISFGAGVLLIMDGCDYSCASFPCEHVPCDLV